MRVLKKQADFVRLFRFCSISLGSEAVTFCHPIESYFVLQHRQFIGVHTISPSSRWAIIRSRSGSWLIPLDRFWSRTQFSSSA